MWTELQAKTVTAVALSSAGPYKQVKSVFARWGVWCIEGCLIGVSVAKPEELTTDVELVAIYLT